MALSRCTTLDGLVLQSLITNNSLFTDERILNFSNTKSNAAALKNNLLLSKQLYQEKTISELFNFDKSVSNVEDILKLLGEHGGSFNEETLPWVNDIVTRLKSLQKIANNFQAQLSRLFLGNDALAINERITKASFYFLDHLHYLVQTLPQSPTVTDSRNYAQEYITDLKTLFAEVYTKFKLVSTCKDGFNMDVFQQHKMTLQIPALEVNAYAGAVYKKVDTPHPILFKQLRALRDEICGDDNLPIYYVANSATLEEMAKYLPLDDKDLNQITGFGEAKIEKYGSQFLSIIQTYCHAKNLTSVINQKPKKEKKEKVADNTKESTSTKTFNFYKQGLNVSEIAAQRNLALSTIESHLAQMVTINEVDIFKLMAAEKVHAVLDAIDATKSDVASVLMMHLGNAYSFSELRFSINYWKYLQKNKAD